MTAQSGFQSRKQGHAMLAALAAVFVGRPLPVAWSI